LDTTSLGVERYYDSASQFEDLATVLLEGQHPDALSIGKPLSGLGGSIFEPSEATTIESQRVLDFSRNHVIVVVRRNQKRNEWLDRPPS
jgi:hypothetical protein